MNTVRYLEIHCVLLAFYSLRISFLLLLHEITINYGGLNQQEFLIIYFCKTEAKISLTGLKFRVLAGLYSFWILGNNQFLPFPVSRGCSHSLDPCPTLHHLFYLCFHHCMTLSLILALLTLSYNNSCGYTGPPK